MRPKRLPKTAISTRRQTITAENNNQSAPILAFLIVNLIWGAANPIIKYTLDFVPPITFLFLRFLIVCIVLLPYIIFTNAQNKLHPKDLKNFFLLGLFSQTSLVITFIALDYTGVLDFVIIGIFASVLTIAAGHYFYKEKITSGLKAGMIIASIGTVIVMLEPLLSSNTNTDTLKRLFGNFLAVLYSFTWVIYTVWSKMSMGNRSTLLKKTLSFIHIKPMHQTYSPFMIIGVTFYVGLATVTPLALLEGFFSYEKLGFALAAISFRGILGILYMSLISSIVAYSLYQWALVEGKVSDSAIIAHAGIIFSFPVAYILLGEIPNLYMIIGGLLIAIGVIIAEKKNT